MSAPSSEVVVDPSWRRHGVGRTLVQSLQQEAPDGRLRLWAHGDHSAAAQLATSLGFTVTRELWQMRRSLFSPLPRPVVPEGVTIRAFRPGEDDAAWLALNAQAFASHPEQGTMTETDLAAANGRAVVRPRGILPRRTVDG